MKNAEKLILGVMKTDWAKKQFLVHVLREHWAGIVGHTAADHSQPYRLDHGILYVHTDHPSWSGQLMMMQGKINGQLNRLLADYARGKGRVRIIRQLKCYHGILEPVPLPSPERDVFMPQRDENRRCPVCGVPLIAGETICSACARRQNQETRRKIHSLLEEAPWMDYAVCRQQVECDKITFTDVKAVLTEWALNRALDRQAGLGEKAFYMMLETGKTPDQLDDQEVERFVEKKRKERGHVSARRK